MFGQNRGTDSLSFVEMFDSIKSNKFQLQYDIDTSIDANDKVRITGDTCTLSLRWRVVIPII
jgi:hypothetical protein